MTQRVLFQSPASNMSLLSAIVPSSAQQRTASSTQANSLEHCLWQWLSQPSAQPPTPPPPPPPPKLLFSGSTDARKHTFSNKRCVQVFSLVGWVSSYTSNVALPVTLASAFIGMLIELWKITKAMHVSIGYWPGGWPCIRFADKPGYSSTMTKQYDDEAMRCDSAPASCCQWQWGIALPLNPSIFIEIQCPA